MLLPGGRLVTAMEKLTSRPLVLVFLGSRDGGVDIALRMIFMNGLVQSSFRKASMLCTWLSQYPELSVEEIQKC